MQKENRVAQSGNHLTVAQYLRARVYSAPNRYHQIVSNRTPCCTYIPTQSVEKRSALQDLKTNINNACNLQRWVCRTLGVSSESIDNILMPKSRTYEHPKLRDSSTQTAVGHRRPSLQSHLTVTKRTCTSERTPTYTSSLEAGPLKRCGADRKYATCKEYLPSSSGRIEEDFDVDDSEYDEVFTSGQQVLRKLSPIVRNQHTSEDTILVPAKAKKVGHKNSSQKRMKLKLLDSRCIYGDIYNREYLEDIMDHLLDKDLKYVVTVAMLRARNVDINARAPIIDWLLKIRDYFQLQSETYLKTVRLFDCILCSTEVAINMYQLIAVTSLWILTKHDDNQTRVPIKKILWLIGGAYSASQLIDMEIKILKYIHYRCDVTEPITFVEYYAKRGNVKNKDVLRASYYILEAFALSPYFSTVPSSLLAASAFYLSLECLGESTNAWEQMRNYRGYYHTAYVRDMRSRMQKVLGRIGTKQFPYNECFKKYNTEEMNFIVSALYQC